MSFFLTDLGTTESFGYRGLAANQPRHDWAKRMDDASHLPSSFIPALLTIRFNRSKSRKKIRQAQSQRNPSSRRVATHLRGNPFTPQAGMEHHPQNLKGRHARVSPKKKPHNVPGTRYGIRYRPKTWGARCAPEKAKYTRSPLNRDEN